MASLLEPVIAFLRSRGLEVDVERVDDGARIEAHRPVGDDDLPWQVFVGVDEVDRRVGIYSLAPLPIPAETRLAVAHLLTRVNYGLVIGNFELDLDDGELRYKTSVDVGDDDITPALLGGMLDANLESMRVYLDAVHSVALGIVPPEDAAAALDEDGR